MQRDRTPLLRRIAPHLIPDSPASLRVPADPPPAPAPFRPAWVRNLANIARDETGRVMGRAA